MAQEITYPDKALPGFIRAQGITKRHISVADHRHPPLTPDQLAAVLQAWQEISGPVLVPCSGGIDRTSVAIALLLEHEREELGSAPE